MLENKEQNQEKIDIAIKSIIELKERYPNSSSSQLAQKVGLAQSTFSRIENKQSVPTISSLSAILSFLNKEYKLANLGTPALNRILKNNLSHNSDSSFLNEKLSKYNESFVGRNILLFALTSAGTTKKEVLEQLGRSGIEVLDKMLSENLLIEENEVIRYADKRDRITIPQDELKSLVIGTISDKYRSDLFGYGANWLSLQTNSIDKTKAMPKIREILKETYTKIQKEVFELQELQGNDKVFVTLASDSLLNEFQGSQIRKEGVDLQ